MARHGSSTSRPSHPRASTRRLLALIAALACVQGAPADTRLAVALGRAADTDAYRIDLSIDRPFASLPWAPAGWRLSPILRATAGYWWSEEDRGSDSLLALGASGLLRWERPPGSSRGPFLELGLGPRLLSETRFADKDFDIPLAFASHLGIGVHAGRDGRLTLSYRFQHLSNAGLGDSNPGINFHLLGLSYRY
jgi:hypothetical protein